MARNSPDNRVAGQPRYRGGEQDAGAGPAREPLTARQRRERAMVIAVVVAVFVVFVVLHVTGVLGPGTNG